MSRPTRVCLLAVISALFADHAVAQTPSVDVILRTFRSNTWELLAKVNDNTGGITAFNVDIVDPSGGDVTAINLAPRIFGETETDGFVIPWGGLPLPQRPPVISFQSAGGPGAPCPTCAFGIGVAPGEIPVPPGGVVREAINTPYDAPVLLARGTGTWDSVGDPSYWNRPLSPGDAGYDAGVTFGGSASFNLYVNAGEGFPRISSLLGDVVVNRIVIRTPEPTTCVLMGIVGLVLFFRRNL